MEGKPVGYHMVEKAQRQVDGKTMEDKLAYDHMKKMRWRAKGKGGRMF